MKNDMDLTVLSNDDLIFQHRAAAASWTRAHMEAFAQDENGEYVHGTRGNPELDTALADAMDWSDKVEAELQRRLDNGR